MLSLLTDPDVDLDVDLDKALQPRLRQVRRATIQAKKKAKTQKEKEAERAAKSLPPKPTRAELARIRMRQKQQDAELSFKNHCLVVAAAITRVACDIEKLATEEQKWFDSKDALIEALATQHNIVSKKRPVLAAASDYERKVIRGALMICEFDKLLHIKEYCGQIRLYALDTRGYYGVGRHLRSA